MGFAARGITRSSYVTVHRLGIGTCQELNMVTMVEKKRRGLWGGSGETVREDETKGRVSVGFS